MIVLCKNMDAPFPCKDWSGILLIQRKGSKSMGNNQEIWKDIEGFEGLYLVSNHGRVFSNITNGGIVLKHRITHYGYCQNTICKDSIRYTFFSHRLIAKAFVPNPDNKPFVNHIDGVKTNNNMNNLEWCTHKENMAHAHRTGLRDVRGEACGMSKLKNKEVLEIRRLYKSGCYTHKMLGIKFGVYETTISKIVNRKTWKHI